MENNRGQSIFLSVVGIATLLVAIVGATFAYFSITVEGNGNASSIHVTTAKLGNVQYSGNNGAINIDNTYPGWTGNTTFTISTLAGTTGKVQYQINLEVIDQDLATAADESGEFIYSLSGSADNDDANVVVASVDSQKVPTTTTTIGTGTLVDEDSHSYTLTYLIKETGASQNYLQGKFYNARIQIVVSTEEGMRTYDATSGWHTYTNSDIRTTIGE